MNFEKAVIELTENINHSGLNEQLIEERELFLCLISAIFINIIEKKKYDELLKLLFECSGKAANFKKLSEKLNRFCFSINSHKILYQELLERLNRITIDKRDLLLNTTLHLPSLDIIKGITEKDAIVIYSHMLQRLQAMNVVDKLGLDFQYQDIPSCFSDLTSLLVNKSEPHSIYDPYAMTGELSAFYAMNNKVKLVTTETLLQSSSYLGHMFCIAGVEDINSLRSFGLSSIANIEPMIADVAFTLLDPTASKEDEKLQKEDDDEIMLTVDDGRIKDKTVPTKFKEHGFVQHLMYSLKNDGKAFIFLGKGPLHREVEKEARAFLLQNNFVDAVIELPPKLIKPRTVTLYALVLKKERTDKLIRFIDASNCYAAVGRLNKLTKLDEIHELYNTQNSIPGRIALMTVDEVIANDNLLMPSSYLSGYKAANPSVNLDDIRIQLFNHAKETDKKLLEIKSFLKEI
jgi:hypothetical protein